MGAFFMPGPTRQKSPLNELVGKLVRQGRRDFDVQDSGLREKLHLKDSYLRGIESGAIACPLDKALEFAETFNWNYKLLLLLLASASICDCWTTESGTGRRFNAELTLRRYQRHLQRTSELREVWEWVIASLRTEADDAYRSSLQAMTDKVYIALGESRTFLAPVEARTAADDEDISPFLANPLKELRRTIAQMERTLSQFSPVIGRQGLRAFDAAHKNRILRVAAFLGSQIDIKRWRDADYDFGFMLNANRPPLHIYLDGDLTVPRRMEAKLAEVIAGKVGHIVAGPGVIGAPSITVTLNRSPQVFNRKIQYHLGRRTWRLDDTRGNQEMTFSNAWIYEVLSERGGSPHLFAVLYDFDPDLPGSDITGVTLSHAESSTLLKALLGESRRH